MKLAIFLDTFHEINGVSLFYKNLIKWNNEFGKYSITFFVISKKKYIYHNNYSTIYFLKPYLPFNFPLYKDQILGIPPKKYIKKIFKEKDFNAILLTAPGPFSLVGSTISKDLSISCFAFYHTRFVKFSEIYGKRIGGVYLESVFRDFSRGLYKKLYSNCKLVFTQSSLLKMDIKSFTNATIVEIPTGVDHKIFFPNIELKPIPKKLIYIGRLALEKNLEIILPILQNIQKLGIDIIFIGDGPLKHKFKQYKCIKITGFIPPKEVGKYLRNSGALLFPSISDTFGNVIMESLASGIPVLVSKNTPTAYFLKKTGASIDFDPLNNKDLLTKINILFENKKVWTKLRENAIKSSRINWGSTYNKIFCNIKDTIS